MNQAKMTYYSMCNIEEYYNEHNKNKIIEFDDNKLLITSKDFLRNLNKKKKRYFKKNVEALIEMDEMKNNENGRKDKITNRLKKKLEEKNNK